jgi:hypothetical protein
MNILRLRSIFNYFINNNSKSIYPPSNYELVFDEKFNNLNEWSLGLGWGDFHPDFPHQYFGTNLEFISIENNILKLNTKNKTKFFYKKDLPDYLKRPNQPEEIIIPCGIGTITSKQEWKYGWFEIEAKLPIGKGLWPALWMYPPLSPPFIEIDIIEAYSNLGNYYSNKCFKNWKFQPNIHYGGENIGGKNYPIKNATNKYIKYICHWTEDFIKIYYNGVLILNENKKSILYHYNNNFAYLRLILGNGICPGGGDDSEFLIKSVKVYQ